MSTTDESMLRVQIGPVQDFIAAARTARDLWSGSYLLSWLMAKAVQAVEKHPGARVIFPCAEELKICRFCATGQWEPGAFTPCLSNKLTAYVPTEQAEALATAVKQAVHEAWAAIAERVWQMLPTGIRTDAERRRRYDMQVQQHLTVEYAHLPLHLPQEQMAALTKGVGGIAQDGKKIPLLKALTVYQQDPTKYYAAAYYLTEHLLNGVRKVRPFEAWNAGRGRDAGWYAGRDLAKDSLTGKEEQILRLQQDAPLCKGWEHLPFFEGHKRDIIGAITLIKRLWYLDLTAGRERELPDLNLQYGPNDAADSADDNHYYAVLAMDGDRIGAALTRDPDFGVDEDYHRRFSAALAAFAQGSAGSVVAEFGGLLIYAGGDDVLALLPLQKALACANEIQQQFCAQMAEVCDSKHPMSMSAGLAFAHSAAPLQDVVAAARRAESRAKTVMGRGAFSICLMKRSGEIAEWGAKWGSGAVELLETWKKCQTQKAISAKGAYRYAELLTPYLTHPTGLVKYGESTGFDKEAATAIAALEFESMLDRQWMNGPAEDKAELRSKLTAYLQQGFTEKPEDDGEVKKEKDVAKKCPIDDLVSLCSVVAFMSRDPNKN